MKTLAIILLLPMSFMFVLTKTDASDLNSSMARGQATVFYQSPLNNVVTPNPSVAVFVPAPTQPAQKIVAPQQTSANPSTLPVPNSVNTGGACPDFIGDLFVCVTNSNNVPNLVAPILPNQNQGGSCPDYLGDLFACVTNPRNIQPIIAPF